MARSFALFAQMLNAFKTRGFVKSVQRGVTAGAGTVTITAVATGKSHLTSYSKGSAGTVAATGNITGSLSLYMNYWSTANPFGGASQVAGFNNGTISGTRTISGGTTNLITKVYSAVLTNATTITVDGPVEWELVEYY